jgi:hypothetical protein
MSVDPKYVVGHVFMTDGAPTIGNTDSLVLSKLINDTFINSIIGFTLDHDAHLLETLATNKNTEYYVIENVNNSELVYAEVINRYLYPVIENISIKVKHVSIYNWRTNEWTDELKEDVFIGEIEKKYQVRTKTADEIRVYLYGSVSADEIQVVESVLNDGTACYKRDDPTIVLIDEIYALPELIESDGTIKNPTNLAIYMFRQKVQELLYESTKLYREKRQFRYEYEKEGKNVSKDLKQKLVYFFRIIRRYMRDHNLNNDKLMQLLCEDIYVTYKNFNTKLGMMYSAARQMSQGRQRTYNVSAESSESSESSESIMNNTIDVRGVYGRQMGRRYEEDVEFEKEMDDGIEGGQGDEDDISNYRSPNTAISCFATETTMNTMRIMSQV